MTVEELRALAADCYGAFSAKLPEPSSRSWVMWGELCEEVPLAAAPFIRSALIRRETLPRNFGAAVRDCWLEWRCGAGRITARTGCPDCDPRIPGFFHYWRRSSHGLLYSGLARCLCNHDPGFDPAPRRSKAGAVREGLVVMPRGCRETPTAFERSLGPAAVGPAGGARAGSSGQAGSSNEDRSTNQDRSSDWAGPGQDGGFSPNAGPDRAKSKPEPV